MRQDGDNLHILRAEGRELPLRVRRNPRARRMTLSLDAASGIFRLSLPRTAALSEGLDFADGQRRWMLARLDGLAPRVPFAPGVSIPYLGVPHGIVHEPAARRGVWREDGTIRVSGSAAHLPRRVGDFLKREARREISARAHDKAGRLGRPIARLALRDTRSRWGSCAADGGLNFSWRLILAPPEVLDYVVAHEVAHLEHHDHGPRFWRLVAELTPAVAGPKRWLREKGGELLRYG
jgi:predicted metal-dependent hydrolase